MFWSLVRPDRILPPITRSAAVTTSLEADELAVGMITCEDVLRGRTSRLINAGRRPFGRLAVLSAYCGRGAVQKKEGAPRPGRGGGRALLNVRNFSWAPTGGGPGGVHRPTGET